MFHIKTRREEISSKQCIIASGGLPMPVIGSDFGIEVAKKFKIADTKSSRGARPYSGCKI